MGIWGRYAAWGIVCLASGCFTIQPHEPVPPPNEIQAAQLMPQLAKNRVHTLLISGLLEPLALQTMRDELIDLGFIKTTHALVGTRSTLEKRLAEIRHKEPDARFVLVGHGGGVALAAELATQLQAQGAAVDALLVLNPAAGEVLPFSGRVVCLSNNGATLHGAENLKLESSTHGLARDPSTLLVLLRELLASASQVRLPTVVAPAGSGAPATAPELPAPRPVPSEWDFIRPDLTPAAVPTDKPILQASYKPGP
jgi:hypothetical protein